jgi:MFS family permease
MLVGFAFSHSLLLSCILLLLSGFAMMIQVGSTNTLIQSTVPDHYRGRVMSVYSMMLIGISPLGAMAAGFAAEHIGAPFTLVIGALICLVSAAWYFSVSRQVPAPAIPKDESILESEQVGDL